MIARRKHPFLYTIYIKEFVINDLSNIQESLAMSQTIFRDFSDIDCLATNRYWAMRWLIGPLYDLPLPVSRAVVYWSSEVLQNGFHYVQSHFFCLSSHRPCLQPSFLIFSVSLQEPQGRTHRARRCPHPPPSVVVSFTSVTIKQSMFLQRHEVL